MGTLDPRLHAFREDLASKELIGKVSAPRYTQPKQYICVVNRASVMRAPDAKGPMDSELLYGETFSVLETKDGWCWGQTAHDGYVGYVAADRLVGAKNLEPPTHRVHLPMTLVFPEPSIKAPPRFRVPMNAPIRGKEQRDRFVETEDGFLISDHLVPFDRPVREDYVSVAGLYMFVPYLWGGRTHEGLDCSGLIQTALKACLIPCPRDSDMQERDLGMTIDPRAPRQRGDFVFWKGHVGIMISNDRIIHANATAMFTSIDMISELEERLQGTEGPVTAVKRLVSR